MPNGIQGRIECRFGGVPKRSWRVRLAGAGSLSGGRELAGAVPVGRESCWADVGATGRGHGLRKGGCGLRLRCIDVAGIRTMNPGRGVTVGQIVWISDLEFSRPVLR